MAKGIFCISLTVSSVKKALRSKIFHLLGSSRMSSEIVELWSMKEKLGLGCGLRVEIVRI